MKKRLVLFALGLGLAGLFVLPAPVFAADVLNPACEGVVDPVTGSPPAACGGNNADQPASGNAIYGPNGLLTRAAGLIARIVGIASVVMIIIGGYKYVTSSGDTGNVRSAKDTIMFAVIGMLVALAAQSIVVFVLSRL
ncbi:MAG TPA: hypothetical protein VK674_05995 [Candidatus Limnocylindria bacterium]|nr:hypothetical protein [Candidatus Limnocylindria bacterium]